MRTMVLTLILAGLYTTSSYATEYIYRDLMANTLPSAKCEDKPSAIATASKPYHMNRFTKRFCQSQGYGWHVEQVKDNGKPVCEVCEDSKTGEQRCHMEDVVVTCKLIKPGSVGMLPGKGVE